MQKKFSYKVKQQRSILDQVFAFVNFKKLSKESTLRLVLIIIVGSLFCFSFLGNNLFNQQQINLKYTPIYLNTQQKVLKKQEQSKLKPTKEQVFKNLLFTTVYVQANTASSIGNISAASSSSSIQGQQTTNNVNSTDGVLSFSQCRFSRNNSTADLRGCLRQILTFSFVIGIFMIAMRIAIEAFKSLNPTVNGDAVKNSIQLVKDVFIGLILIGTPGIFISIFNPAALNLNLFDILADLGQKTLQQDTTGSTTPDSSDTASTNSTNSNLTYNPDGSITINMNNGSATLRSDPNNPESVVVEVKKGDKKGIFNFNPSNQEYPPSSVPGEVFNSLQEILGINNSTNGTNGNPNPDTNTNNTNNGMSKSNGSSVNNPTNNNNNNPTNNNNNNNGNSSTNANVPNSQHNRLFAKIREMLEKFNSKKENVDTTNNNFKNPLTNLPLTKNTVLARQLGEGYTIPGKNNLKRFQLIITPPNNTNSNSIPASYSYSFILEEKISGGCAYLLGKSELPAGTSFNSTQTCEINRLSLPIYNNPELMQFATYIWGNEILS